MIRPLLVGVLLAGLGGCAADPPPEPSPSAPTLETTYRWAGDAWEPSSRQRFAYPSGGAEAELVEEEVWADGTWTDGPRHRWTLDPDGRQRAGERYSPGDPEPGMRTRFTYQDGRKTSATRYVRTDDGWVPGDSLASTFDGDHEVGRTFYAWADDGWAVRLKQTSTYDAEGRELERLHTAPTADGWANQRRWTFTYDGDRMAESLVDDWTDGAWAPWLRQRYAYDADERLRSVIHEEWAGGTWRPWMRHETLYGPIPHHRP